VLTAESFPDETHVSDAIDNLEKLETKVLKAADLLRRTQAEKRSLLEQLTKIRADLEKQAKASEGLERDVLSLRREREEVQTHPEEEQEELSLFYQLKGVPKDEAEMLAVRMIAQPESALKTLGNEELGISEESFQNPWAAAISASLSTATGAFIPIIPFFFTKGYPAIIISFVISALSHFLIGAAKTVVTGLSPWRSGAEMTIIGLGEALITYGLGLLFGPIVG